MAQTEKPKIWVDADSFPSPARNVIQKIAIKNNLQVIYVANRNIAFNMESSLFEMKICPSSPGAADEFIVSSSAETDIVATRDIPLAARLVERGISVINDRGVNYDKKTVEKRLKERELSLQMEALGLHKGYRHESYGNRELQAFEKCLTSVLSQKLFLLD